MHDLAKLHIDGKYISSRPIPMHFNIFVISHIWNYDGKYIAWNDLAHYANLMQEAIQGKKRAAKGIAILPNNATDEYKYLYQGILIYS